MNDNDDFIRQYAAEIAKALRQQQDNSSAAKTSVEESIPILYRSLCFDEPILDTDVSSNLSVVASGLSRQLLSKSSKFALSNRLVNGVVYLCQQQQQQQQERSSQNNNAKTTTTTNLAVAKLAFCCLIQVPLECCQQLDHWKTVQQYLGSFKGSLVLQTTSTTTQEKDEPIGSDDTEKQQIEQLSHAMNAQAQLENKGGDSTPGEQLDSSSLQEVWAAESDPSDYDYGEGVADDLPSSMETFQEDWLDPYKLSRADLSLTRSQGYTAIGSLLQQVKYTTLEPIFANLSSSSKDLQLYISQVTQLLLILLQPNKENEIQNIFLVNDDGDKQKAAFENAILSPLWLLRDAALHATSSASSQQFYTSSYLDILQTLLAVDQAYIQDMTVAGQATTATDLCSASIVGLAALSSWCSMAKISVKHTIPAILDSMNDLAHVVERASTPTSTSDYTENLRHSLVPIMEVLTGITYDRYHPPPATSLSSSSPNAIAQTLLNSGLLRLLLTLALDVSNSNTKQKEGNQPHHRFHHMLWGLCAAYPKVVGKYVMRYPGISQLVRHYSGLSSIESSPPSSRDYVHSILWNAFGWSHCSGVDAATAAPQLIWKTKGTNSSPFSPPLSADECSEVCRKAWTRLLHLVESSAQELVESSEYSEESTRFKATIAVLDDWERLLEFLRIPSIGPAAAMLLMRDDVSTRLTTTSNLLSTLSSRHNEDENTADTTRKTNTKDGDAANDDTNKKKTPASQQQLVLSRARKLLKQYTLFFQGNLVSSSKTD